MTLMRKHKVDMNLTVDYDAAGFFRDVLPAPAAETGSGGERGSTLLTQLGSLGPHLLSLFIASLRSDSVLDSLYPFAPQPANAPVSPNWSALAVPMGLTRMHVVDGPGATSKVDAVCDLMQEAIKAQPDGKLRTCMVLTFVRRHPPRVEDALQHLQVF